MKERTGWITFKGNPLTLIGNEVKAGNEDGVLPRG